MKIITDKDIPLIEEYFSAAAEVIKLDGRRITAEDVKQADALIVRSITTVDKNLLHGSNVSYVATVTSGTDHIDIDYLNGNGIGFCNTAGSNARSVAEYVISSLCVLMDQYGLDLEGKTAAIIGCGHIGSLVDRFFRIIGLQCQINDPPLRDATGSDRYCDIEDVYAADIITLHVPLEKDGKYPTWRMIDSAFLRRLKKDVILVNTSRGDVIDETALLEFLAGNCNAKTVLDVWCGEPVINMDLLSYVNIGTAHIAGYSMDSKYRAVDNVCRQVAEYFNIHHNTDFMIRTLGGDISGITISASLAVRDAIQMAVLASYDVRTDSSALRQVLEVEPGRSAEYFDELRSQYRIRREFDSLQVNLSPPSALLANKLAELGFRLPVK